MSATSVDSVLGFVRRLSGGPSDEDALLLLRFRHGEHEAFSALLHRHGPLVWGVCQRALGPTPDAEDAFQATFLVLLQKADTLTDGRPLAPWLHRVASRAASKTRLREARRLSREARSARTEQVSPPESPCDLQHILDEEVGRLPERYREPIVLCYLEGLTNEEAARRLACPRGTILSRLSRARDRLRARLSRRGLDLPTTMVSAGLVPGHLVGTLARAAAQFQLGTETGLSSTVIFLAKGVVVTMFQRQREWLGLALIALLVTVSGAGLLGGLGARPKTQPTRVAPALPGAGLGEDREVEPQKDVKQPPAAAPRFELNKQLSQMIEFPGIDDPKASMVEALEMLTRTHKVPFDINERAFRAEYADRDVLKVEIAATNPVPPMKASLRTVLMKILSRIPAASGATFLVRKEGIEITTEAFARAELGLPTRASEDPMLRLLVEKFEEVALPRALETIADVCEMNIVIDPRVKKNADIKVTANLRNVPIEAAVKLLANMAELEVVLVGNVLYITSSENAATMKGTPIARIPGKLSK